MKKNKTEVLKETIVSLIDEKRSLEDKASHFEKNFEWYKKLFHDSCEKHEMVMREEKAKYALLLEKYISVLERVAKIESDEAERFLSYKEQGYLNGEGKVKVDENC